MNEWLRAILLLMTTFYLIHSTVRDVREACAARTKKRYIPYRVEKLWAYPLQRPDEQWSATTWTDFETNREVTIDRDRDLIEVWKVRWVTPDKASRLRKREKLSG